MTLGRPARILRVAVRPDATPRAIGTWKASPVNSQNYVRLLRKRWRTLTIAILIGLLASSAYVLTATKTYRATAQIFVSISNSDSGNAAELAQGNTFTQARVQSYTSEADSPAVTDAVIKQLGLTMSSRELADKISADAPINKVLINLHVTDTNPAQAAALANAVATQFGTVIEELERTSSTTPSPVKLSVTHPAQVPGSPASPRYKLDVLLGLLAGLVIGFVLALARDFFDNTVKDAGELTQQTQLPVLGEVHWDKRTAQAPMAFRADAHGMRAETFRQMRINLEFVDVDSPPKVIAVTSSLPGEGKSHTAMNLAAALAETGRRVCLIEADLRKPSLATSLGLIGDVGLTTVLLGRATVEEVLQNAGRNLAVLTSGPVPPNPSELLNSEAFRALSTASGTAWTSSSSTPLRSCPSPTACRSPHSPTRRCSRCAPARPRITRSPAAWRAWPTSA